MGAPKISKWGTLDCLISSGKEVRSLKLNNSHLAMLMQRPSSVPRSWIMARTQAMAAMGPATTPSSMYHCETIGMHSQHAPQLLRLSVAIPVKKEGDPVDHLVAHLFLWK